jgi:uncharacterized protein
MNKTESDGGVLCPRCDGTLGPDDLACRECGASRVVCGRFRITKLLGRGGMGRIYEATEEPGGRRVAVKVLSLGSSSDWLLRDLFERSTHVLMGLAHPALPKVYAFEQDDAGRFVLVRDAFDGGTLEERIVKDDRRLALSEVTALLEALLDLLVYLQTRVPPVIHRDIKPSNVMFRAKGDDAPVLVDFDTVAAPEGRRTGVTIVGTPGYTAPEQFAGEASPSSDVYSLGTTMLFVVTHVAADDLRRVAGRFDVGSALAPLDAATRRVLTRMVEVDRSKRYETAAEALEDLRRVDTVAAGTRRPDPAREPLPDPVPALDGLPRGRRSTWIVLPMLIAFGLLPWWITRQLHNGRATTPAVATRPQTSAHRSTLDNGCKANDSAECTARCLAGEAQSCGTLGIMYENGTNNLGKDEARAAALYGQACSGGYTPSCAKLGFLYQMGRGVNKDVMRAVALYAQACTPAGTTGCNNLGIMYRDGLGVTKDDARAVALYKQACDGGNAVGCMNLGFMYEKGRGVKNDYPRAATLYTQACTGGNADGCNRLGFLYRDGLGVTKDEAHSVALSKQACDAGFMSGCYSLGFLYEKGRGVVRDAARATTLYGQACTGGDTDGCAALGWTYSQGFGVEKDLVRGATISTQACDDGNAQACNNLGTMYESGRGVTKDAPKAFALYDKSCTTGNAQACTNVAASYLNGFAVKKDEARALALLKQTCDGGYAGACARLGLAYENGTGVAKDLPHAVVLYQQACDGGSAAGCGDIGYLMASGSGVSRDDIRATALDKQGCDGNDARSCSSLGYLVENGRAGLVDRTRAVALYRQGCKGGNDWGCTQLKRLGESP